LADLAVSALLLVNWVVAFAYFAPTALSGRISLYRRPTLGLALWFGFFVASVLALTAAALLACYSIFATWAELQATRVGSDRWFEALVFSFAPWLVLAFAGIAAGLANQRLEGLFQPENRITPGLLGARHVSSFDGFRVLELPLEFVYLGSSATDQAILQTTGARCALSREELLACYQHEAAHLKGHHSKITASLTVPVAAFGWLAVTRAMTKETSLFLELLADKSVSDKLALRTALAKVGSPDNETSWRLKVLGE
jgi:Zn-dependent protease with chaperone function